MTDLLPLFSFDILRQSVYIQSTDAYCCSGISAGSKLNPLRSQHMAQSKIEALKRRLDQDIVFGEIGYNLVLSHGFLIFRNC